MKIVALGEVLWDVFPDGRETLGGTTANFTLHARGLGADARLISRIGRDPRGDAVQRIFRERGVATDTLQIDADAPTGTVIVAVAADGQPKYRIVEDVAWDRLEVDATACAAVAEADAICFGTLGQRSELARNSIRSLLSLAKPGSLRVFDLNLRDPFWDETVIRDSLHLCNVLKLNADELAILGKRLGYPAGLPLLRDLVTRYNLRLAALTRGSEGSLLVTKEQVSDVGGVSTKVRDTIGAGDAFAATLTVGMLQSWPLGEINERANVLAAYVCTQEGATPILPERLW